MIRNLDYSLISIVICNYNYSQFISQCIQSALKQTYNNIEIIIVDDGSTDHSREIINSFSDDRIIRIFQGNKGQAAAFNTGFAKCSGEYIAFLDSDDFWFPNKLEKIIPIFKQDNINIVQHNLAVVDEHSKMVGKSHPDIRSGLKNVIKSYLKENHTGFFSTTSGIVCRKKDLDRIFPLNTEWQICADVAFTRPMPLFGLTYTVNENLGAYRIHSSNNWMNTKMQLSDRYENQEKYCDYTNEWLENYGYKKQINFSKSKLAKKLLNPDRVQNRYLVKLINFLKNNRHLKC